MSDELDDTTLLSDDLMPSDASSVYNPEPPVNEDRAKATSAERAMVQAAAPMFEKLIQWFEHEIELASTIDQLNVESNVPLAAQVVAAQEVKKRLTEARNRLLILQRTYLD